MVEEARPLDDAMMPERGFGQVHAVSSIVRIAFLGCSIGLFAWALLIMSWIFEHGSVRLVAPNGLILLVEVFTLTVLLGAGSVLVVFELRTLGGVTEKRRPS